MDYPFDEGKKLGNCTHRLKPIETDVHIHISNRVVGIGGAKGARAPPIF